MIEIEAYDATDAADERLCDFLEAQSDLIQDGVVA